MTIEAITMPTNERTRLRIRQYLTDLMDEEAADAMMESMPDVEWNEIATKADITRLDGRIDSLTTSVHDIDVRLTGRLDDLTGRVDGLTGRMEDLTGRMDAMNIRMDDMSGRIDQMGGRIDDMSGRIDQMGGRIDQMGGRIDDLNRSVAFAALTMAVTLAVFIAGSIVPLFS